MSTQVRSQVQISCVLLSVALLSWLLPSNGAQAASPIQVCVSIPPQKYFVEQIAADRVSVSVLAKPGADPHTYEPKPSQMVALTRARAYFSIGITFEKAWLPKLQAANPQMLIVPTDAGIEKIPMESPHGHGSTPETSVIPDPHVWTAPLLVKIQAKNILDGLLTIDPSHRAAYESGFHAFSKKLDEIHAELKEIFAGRQGMEFMVFHPAWAYFAKSYGLKQLPIEFEGKAIKPARLKHIIQHAREHGIRVLFVQPQVSTQSAETIAKAIGGEVVYADPLAYDWMTHIKKQAERFKAALK